MSCDTVIDLQRTVRSEKRRGFQPPWYLVYVYRCPTCGKERYILAASVPEVGSIKCDG